MISVGNQVVFDRAQRLKVDGPVVHAQVEAAAEGVVEKQHVGQHPQVIPEQQHHVIMPPRAARAFGHTVKQ